MSTTLELRVLGCRILRLSIERTNFLTARSKEALCFLSMVGLHNDNRFSISSSSNRKRVMTDGPLVVLRDVDT